MHKNSKSFQVQKMFDQIAGNYDLMNYIMSLGNHKKWEQELISSNINKNIKILDIACGTGSLTKELIKITSQKNVIGLDFSESMIYLAQNKNINNLILGDSHHIPVKSNTFELITIAYGIRNFENLSNALNEIKRCLNKNGTLKIIEIIKPKNTLRSLIFKIGFNVFAPILGIIISRNIKAYRYLPKSANLFLSKDSLYKLLDSHGFKNINIKQKLFGSVILLETSV
jgi:demethylmenaquinone methyltransferase/2-methoxy-6-polyprenyl-1,4-benzoquinol methylase